MEEIFVTKLRINKVRHLENLEIPLSETERKHLILTGKNGSGKTSILEALNERLYLIYLSNLQFVQNEIDSGNTDKIEDIIQYGTNINDNEDAFFYFNKVELLPEKVTKEEFVIAFFKAKRKPGYHRSESIKKININDYYHQHETANRIFLDYLVYLRTEKSFAHEENDYEKVRQIDTWFTKFEDLLKDIFGEPNLKTSFDRKGFNYNFLIKLPDRDSFDLTDLSDGYAAILDIVSELIMRMENKSSQVYDLQGIVLIDEIETHLHIDLQKKILPFLTSFFPKIQFIVTTHSPFVLSSIDNAVIYDLEKQQIGISDLSGYSADGIIEGYFEQDKYSEKLKGQVSEYEILMGKDVLNDDESDKLYFLEKYFEELPKFLAPELQVKIQQIKLAKLA